MGQLKFDKKGVFIPQRIKFSIKHNELDEEMIDNYVKKECDTPYECDLITKSINHHIKNKNLIKTKKDYLKLDGVGGEKEIGD
ncbi:hypothetical protein ES705_08703 [subsurface metagenome]